jgi:sarcosine oxidase subunit alpha
MKDSMAARIQRHPILVFPREKELTFRFDGDPVNAFEGETIAAALHAAGVTTYRKSARYGRHRGFYCAIGKCSSCLMKVDDRPNVRICITPVREGMVVESQQGKGQLPIDDDLRNPRSVSDLPEVSCDILIIGSGPAGLAAAVEATRSGSRVIILDENDRPGGQLIKQTHKFFGSREHYAKIRGIDIAEKLLEEFDGNRPEIHLETTATGIYDPFTVTAVKDNRLVIFHPKRVILATGASENMLLFDNNDLPGVYGAGAVQTLMNVAGVAPGRRVVMVGAGNIGLIVSYQLLQAGVEVCAIVEALSEIGGYSVHAAKVRRMGVPILTRHTLKAAVGEEKVEGAVIVKIDEEWRMISGTETSLEVDTICLAVGLSPTIDLLLQAGCQIRYNPLLGGHIPVVDENYRTSRDEIYCVGDLAGIEEASIAMVEGRIAGIAAASSLVEKYDEAHIQDRKKNLHSQLRELRLTSDASYFR